MLSNSSDLICNVAQIDTSYHQLCRCIQTIVEPVLASQGYSFCNDMDMLYVLHFRLSAAVYQQRPCVQSPSVT